MNTMNTISCVMIQSTEIGCVIRTHRFIIAYLNPLAASACLACQIMKMNALFRSKLLYFSAQFKFVLLEQMLKIKHETIAPGKQNGVSCITACWLYDADKYRFTVSWKEIHSNKQNSVSAFNSKSHEMYNSILAFNQKKNQNKKIQFVDCVAFQS